MHPESRNIKFNRDWITRPLFGFALAAITVAAIFGGALYVAIFAGAISVAAAREWHRMITSRALGPDFFLTSATIVAALAAGLFWPAFACSAGRSLRLARSCRWYWPRDRREPVLWQGAGAIYLGVPMLAILLLRDAPHGAMIIIGLFIAIWTTDTGALIFGNLIGGPRLAPSLSPNKTWAGTLGGIVVAAAAEAGFVMLLGGHAVTGVVLRQWYGNRCALRRPV